MTREYRSVAVERALDALTALSEAPEGLSLTSLAQRIEVPASTLLGILSSLGMRGAVVVDSHKRYRLGAGLFQLGQAFNDDGEAAERFDVHGAALSSRCGETVQLSVLVGPDVVYLRRHQPPDAIALVARLGQRIPAHASAAGKALLARMSDEEVCALVGADPLPSLTPRTITSSQMLLRNLAQIKRRGFAEAREECILGIHCFAAPVVNYDGVAVAALSISVPPVRADRERRSTLVQLLRETAADLSEDLGATLLQARSRQRA